MMNDKNNIDLREMPYNNEAEYMVLACILVGLDEAFNAVSGILKPEMFYPIQHQLIYKHMCIVKNDGRQVNIVSVCESLQEVNELSQVASELYPDAKDYLRALLEATGSWANGIGFAYKVKHYYLRREIIYRTRRIIDIAFGELGLPFKESWEMISSELTELQKLGVTKSMKSIKQVNSERVGDLIQELNNPSLQTARFLPTQYKTVDNFLAGGGLGKGTLNIIAGRPGMGKSALAMSMASRMAIHNKLPTLIFSLEMTNKDVADRLNSELGHLPFATIKNGLKVESDMQAYVRGVTTLNDKAGDNLFLADLTDFTVNDIISECRSMKNISGSIGVVLIDYVQIIKVANRDKFGNRNNEISEISRALKSLALELDCPIVLLAQLNREVENRQDKRSTMADLRDSGALEQDADLIMLLYRDKYYNPSSYNNDTEINVAKNRNGQTGKLNLRFVPEYMRFEDII